MWLKLISRGGRERNTKTFAALAQIANSVSLASLSKTSYCLFNLIIFQFKPQGTKLLSFPKLIIACYDGISAVGKSLSINVRTTFLFLRSADVNYAGFLEETSDKLASQMLFLFS